MSARTAQISRQTAETRISLDINLDGAGKARLETGVPFFEHMLDQVARHGLIDINLSCDGDTQIDDHHTVEDCGIVLGQAVSKAVGDKRGIFATATPMCRSTKPSRGW